MPMPSRPLQRVIYRSRAAVEFDMAALLGMLASARTHNAERRITGVLVCEHGQFLQLLEGPTDEVEDLLQRILRDRRHEAVEVLVDEPCESRWFGDWSMDFADYDRLPGRHPGSWTLALPRHLEQVVDRCTAETVLRAFADAA